MLCVTGFCVIISENPRISTRRVYDSCLLFHPARARLFHCSFAAENITTCPARIFCFTHVTIILIKTELNQLKVPIFIQEEFFSFFFLLIFVFCSLDSDQLERLRQITAPRKSTAPSSKVTRADLTVGAEATLEEITSRSCVHIDGSLSRTARRACWDDRSADITQLVVMDC